MTTRRNLGRTLLAAGILVVGAAPARSGDGTAPAAAPTKPPIPKYENLRFREDWSNLRSVPPCERCDLSDRMKAVQLWDSCSWVNVGGQLRLRFEAWDNQNFGALPGDDAWELFRGRLFADVHLGEHVRVFAEGIYASEEGRDAGPRPVDVNEGDLLNAFADVKGDLGCSMEVGLRVGRQEMLFAKQRLIGPLDWANTRRPFEGVSAWLKAPNQRLDAFYVEPVHILPYEFDEAFDDVQFAGLYYSNTRVKDLKWDAYLLYLHRDAAKYGTTTAEEKRGTLGATGGGPLRGTRFDWDAEAAFQFGDWGAESISAGMATAELGWKPCVRCWEPRVALGADWASGDEAGGTSLNTYNQLFPTGHLFFGWADLIGRQNLIAARLTVTAKPTPKATLRLDLHEFWRASPDDAVYNAGGAVLRAASGSQDRQVGTELDLQAKYALDRHWDLEGGYSHVIPGAFLDATGPHLDTDFAYLQATFTF